MAKFKVTVEFEVEADDETAAAAMMQSVSENLCSGDILTASVEQVEEE